LNLKLNTVIDTDKNNLYVINYVLSNPNVFVPADETEDNSDSVVRVVQVEAKFPDDWGAYLGRNLDPTVPAINNAPNGIYTATVSFLVDENGNVSDVRAENDPGYGTEEAIRVIKKGHKWIPAIKDGKNVACRQKLSIVFKVSGQ
jgi:periplasmic protein TonB